MFLKVLVILAFIGVAYLIIKWGMAKIKKINSGDDATDSAIENKMSKAETVEKQADDIEDFNKDHKKTKKAFDTVKNFLKKKR